MNIEKKNYTAPEVEIEEYTILSSIMTLSQGLEGTGTEYEGGDDWDF